MNIQEYISSGVLESYVMGELSEQEMRKVECMALVHEDISKELKSIEESFEMLVMDTAVSPSAGLKAKIWADIEGAKKQEVPVVAMNTVEEINKDSSGFNWARAASVAAVVGLAALTWVNYADKKELTAQLNQQKNAQIEIDQKLSETRLNLEHVSEELAIVTSVEYVPVVMKGTDNAPSSLAQVYWSAGNQDVYLRVAEMAPLPAGKVYQLWALDGGVPVDAGTFTPDEKGLIRMKNIVSGQAFAVTIEDEGGAATPALETLQVIGNVPV